MSKTILVTGVSGFMGRALSQELASRGHQVIGVLNPNSPQVQNHQGLTQVSVDLNNSDAFCNALKKYKPDALIHLAGRHAFAPTLEIYRDNVLCTASILEALKSYGREVPTILASSSAAYGKNLEKHDAIDEVAEFEPLTAYGVSKATVDLMGYQIFQVNELPVMRIRPFNIIGPGQSQVFLCSKLAFQIASAEKKPMPAVLKLGNIQTTRDFLDVRDSTQAILQLLEKGQPGEAYNVCSGNAVAIKTVIDQMLKLSKISFDLQIEDHSKKNDVARQCGSFQKIFKQTGWQPQISLEQSLKDILEDWRQKL